MSGGQHQEVPVRCDERPATSPRSMFSTTDTIVAEATPPGRGGIGIVRLSGADAHCVARALIVHDGPLQARYATFAGFRSRVDAARTGEAEGPAQPAVV